MRVTNLAAQPSIAGPLGVAVCMVQALLIGGQGPLAMILEITVFSLQGSNSTGAVHVQQKISEGIRKTKFGSFSQMHSTA